MCPTIMALFNRIGGYIGVQVMDVMVFDPISEWFQQIGDL